LFSEKEHFILSIDGIGGLGKTALADFLTRQTIKTTRFDEIAWVTAKHTHLSMLGTTANRKRPSCSHPTTS
jgi:hypothetical protein